MLIMFQKVSILVLFCALFNIHQCFRIENIRVYGPGLQPHKIVMQARYFYINFTYINEEKYIPRLHDLFVDITGNGYGRPCHLWSNKLDRKDGTFIVRYKTYDICKDLTIEVRYRNEMLVGFPLYIGEEVPAAVCVCPDPNFERWRKNYGCPKAFKQWNSMLKPFQKVDMKSAVKKIIERFHNPASTSFCHYVIKSNNLFRECFGEHVGFNMFSDDILLFLTRIVNLPNMEFVINLGDYPLVKKETEPLPIFSWCGSEDTIDIVMPTYDLTEASLENMGRVTLDMLAVQGKVKPWPQRKPIAFWRGRDSRAERLRLIELARSDPELFNVSLTNFFFFKDKEVEYGPKQNNTPFYEFFDYKYQINIDGTVAAYRLPYLLGGAGLVLKQESPFFEHFYNMLKPWVHYVPIKRNLSDLKEKLLWARDHDEKAHQIANNARKFANEHLLPQNVICYYATLLKEWSRRLTKPVKILPNMEYIRQPIYSTCPRCTKFDTPDFDYNEHDEL